MNYEKIQRERKITDAPIELAFCQKYLLLRPTKGDPDVFLVDENKQVFEIGNKSPIVDCSKYPVFDKMEAEYEAIKEAVEKKDQKERFAFIESNYSEYEIVETSILDPKDKTKTLKVSHPKMYNFNMWFLKILKKLHEQKIESVRLDQEISSVSNTPSKYCYFYFNPDSIKNSEIPADCWLQFENRFSAHDWRIFKAWIWGIFEDFNEFRQSLLLFDEAGQSGKGALVDALIRFIGPTNHGSISEDTFSANNSFRYEGVIGKRLTTWAEPDNFNFDRSKGFKSLTGADTVSVNRKGRGIISEKIDTRLLIHTNTAPKYNVMDETLNSRIIVLKMITNDEICEDAEKTKAMSKYIETDEDGNLIRIGNSFKYRPEYMDYKKKLLEELPNFLVMCKEAFDASPKTRNQLLIATDQNFKREFVPPDIEYVEDFFKKYVVIDRLSDTLSKDIRLAIEVHHRESKCPHNLHHILNVLRGTFIKNKYPDFKKRHTEFGTSWRGMRLNYKSQATIEAERLDAERQSIIDKFRNREESTLPGNYF